MGFVGEAAADAEHQVEGSVNFPAFEEFVDGVEGIVVAVDCSITKHDHDIGYESFVAEFALIEIEPIVDHESFFDAVAVITVVMFYAGCVGFVVACVLEILEEAVDADGLGFGEAVFGAEEAADAEAVAHGPWEEFTFYADGVVLREPVVGRPAPAGFGAGRGFFWFCAIGSYWRL